MSYVLHITNKNYSSWSLRPWVLMRALGIAFDEVLHPFTPGNAPDFRKLSPAGKVPWLVDGDTVVWESLAIAEYLAERHPGIWPAAAAARAWARCAAAEMHSGFTTLRRLHGMNIGVRVAVKQRSPALLADIARIEGLWNEGLARFGGPFLAGAAFTADAVYAGQPRYSLRVRNNSFGQLDTLAAGIAEAHAPASCSTWSPTSIRTTPSCAPSRTTWRRSSR
jgi:glutathione S-transferase